MSDEAYLTCDECGELYQGNPPCESCATPRILQEGRPLFRAWELWQTLSFFARPGGFGLSPILLSEAIQLLRFWGEAPEQLELILQIERLMYPKLAQPKEDHDTKARQSGATAG